MAGLLVVCPLSFGFSIAFLLFVRGEVEGDDLVTKPFSAFNRYGRMLGASLLVAVLTFLWSLAGSLAVEGTQLLFMAGSFDVDDVILNVGGAVLFAILLAARRRGRGKRKKSG